MELPDRIEALSKDVDAASPETLRAAVSPMISLIMRIGRRLGVEGILRHYKWREVMLADKLKHVVNARTSTGRGGDATADDQTMCEYKTSKIDDAKLRRWIRRGKLDISLVYNGAYGKDRITPYLDQRHFFGLFDEETEQFLLAVEVPAKLVVEQLLENDSNRRPGQTTNLNTVSLEFPDARGRVVLHSASAAFDSLVKELAPPALRSAMRH